MNNNRYSIVIPAYNEEDAIGKVLEEIFGGEMKDRCEVIVVDDHSRDGTLERARKYPVTVLHNLQNFGYGYSLKRGITQAVEDHIIILDADGSYPVAALSALIAEYEKGFHMVVGARQGVHYHGSLLKRIARVSFRFLSEFATGRRIPDINSGCRVFRKDLSMRFFHTLSSGFSFTTTVTLAFMLNAYSVHYIPIEYHKRAGFSKVNHIRDTLRSLQIIVEAILFYNPIKIFLLCAIAVFLAGVACAVLALVAPVLAMIIFFAIALSVLVMALGFIGVLLKFMHNDSN